MATLDWPIDRPFTPRMPDGISITPRSPKSAWAGFYTGNRQTQGHLADRLQLNLTLPACAPADGASRKAFITHLSSSGDFVRLGDFTQRVPRGTLRGSPVVAANALAGARAVFLSGCRAGANVFGGTLVYFPWLDGWTTFNATATYNTGTDPAGTSTAVTMTRVTTGNHYLTRTYSLAATANRSCQFSVWVKAGTGTGDVRLTISDGAGGNSTSRIITPTASWEQQYCWGYIGAGSAANILCHVDPVNDAGSAGDTLLLWFAELRIEENSVSNCYFQNGATTAPADQDQSILARHLIRLATGDHVAWRTVIRSVAVGETWTYSVWLRLVTLTGMVRLSIQSVAGTVINTVDCTVTGVWQRFSVTGTFAATATGIRGFINPLNDGGSAGDLLAVWGEQLEPGAAVTEHYPVPTLNGGDCVSVGGNLLMVGYAGASANQGDTMTLPLARPLLKPLTTGEPLLWSAPTGRFELLADEITFEHGFDNWQRAVTLPFLEVP